MQPNERAAKRKNNVVEQPGRGKIRDSALLVTEMALGRCPLRDSPVLRLSAWLGTA